MSFTNVIGGLPLRQIATATYLCAAAIIGFSATAVVPTSTMAQSSGDLVVAPTRVVFEGRTRSAQLGLVNKGSGAATYRISVINMRMSENGQLTEIAEPEPGQQFADRLFRYSPRQVTLEPGASQAIRLLLRKPKDLPPGEYRSHLMMRAVPDEAGQSVEAPAPADGGISVTLIPIFGIAIPVIVRHGDLDYSAEISELEYVKPAEANQLGKIRFNLSRTGDRSTFGDLTASIDDGGKEVVLAQVMRLAVYTPNKNRIVEMPLRIPEGVSMAGKKITLKYKTTAEEGAKLLAESAAQLP